MRGAAIALALAACTTSVGSIEQGVVGGSDDPGDPAVVAVELGGSCSGAVIAPRVVLTAAHCLDGGDGVVRLGARAPWDDTIAIVAQHAHHAYRGADDGPDLGFVRLARAASATPIARRAAAPDGLAALRIVGFGRAAAGSPLSAGVKRTGTIAIAAITAAAIVGGDGGPVFTCAGDSGAPGLDGDGAVVAVVSAGDAACAGATRLTRIDVERSYVEQLVAAWDGPCAADGGCATGCATIDPDCDACGVDGTCAAGCAAPDLDCPFVAGGTGGLGAPCDGADDCVSGLCDRAVGACSVPCGVDDVCPSGYACGAAGDAALCKRDDGGCRVAGDRRGGLVLALGLAAWLRRRRVIGRPATAG